MECKFCNGPTELMSDIYVCNECQTVCFVSNLHLDKIKHLTSEYLNQIQCRVLEQQNFLHDIEQNNILGKVLSDTELEFRDKMMEFQSIRIELELYIKGSSDFSDKKQRHLLYRLVVLSEWLKKHFN